MRAEIGEVAMDLFLEQGFEATTIDQIVERSGISRRSLFRYFASKEDIALANALEQGQAVLRALQARPDGEGPWQALRAAVFESGELDPSIAPEKVFSVWSLLRNSIVLQGHRLQKQKQWQELLSPEIAKRVRDAQDPDVTARGIVATALACFDAAGDVWVERGGTGDVLEIFDLMISTVRR